VYLAATDTSRTNAPGHATETLASFRLQPAPAPGTVAATCRSNAGTTSSDTTAAARVHKVDTTASVQHHSTIGILFRNTTERNWDGEVDLPKRRMRETQVLSRRTRFWIGLADTSFNLGEFWVVGKVLALDISMINRFFCLLFSSTPPLSVFLSSF